MDVLLCVGHLQEQKLRDDDVGNVVIHRRAEENDAVHEQAGINIPRPFAASGLLHHNWNEKILHDCKLLHLKIAAKKELFQPRIEHGENTDLKFKMRRKGGKSDERKSSHKLRSFRVTLLISVQSVFHLWLKVSGEMVHAPICF
jgi:hypothetical protein